MNMTPDEARHTACQWPDAACTCGGTQHEIKGPGDWPDDELDPLPDLGLDETFTGELVSATSWFDRVVAVVQTAALVVIALALIL